MREYTSPLVTVVCLDNNDLLTNSSLNDAENGIGVEANYSDFIFH